jgi:hypothetical protein
LVLVIKKDGGGGNPGVKSPLLFFNGKILFLEEEGKGFNLRN